jgi:hypothetical protein
LEVREPEHDEVIGVSSPGLMEDGKRELSVSGSGASLGHSAEKPCGKACAVFDLCGDPPGVNVGHVAPLSASDGDALPSDDSRNAALASLPSLVTHGSPHRRRVEVETELSPGVMALPSCLDPSCLALAGLLLLCHRLGFLEPAGPE